MSEEATFCAKDRELGMLCGRSVILVCELDHKTGCIPATRKADSFSFSSPSQSLRIGAAETTAAARCDKIRLTFHCVRVRVYSFLAF